MAPIFRIFEAFVSGDKTIEECHKDQNQRIVTVTMTLILSLVSNHSTEQRVGRGTRLKNRAADVE